MESDFELYLSSEADYIFDLDPFKINSTVGRYLWSSFSVRNFIMGVKIMIHLFPYSLLRRGCYLFSSNFDLCLSIQEHCTYYFTNSSLITAFPIDWGNCLANFFWMIPQSRLQETGHHISLILINPRKCKSFALFSS